MIKQTFIVLSLLATLSACKSEPQTAKIIVEYTKTPEVLVITDEMLDPYNTEDRIRREHFFLAATIWAEARGDGYYGMKSVAYVIANRIQNDFRTDGTIEGTVKFRKQFSCWNKGDPNRPKLKPSYLENTTGTDNAQWETAKQIAWEIMKNGTENDTTENSLFYHAKYVNPNWKDTSAETVTVGQHVFYSEAK